MADASVAPVEQTDSTVSDSGQGSGQPKDYVTLETHRRLLDEKKKAQARLVELEAKEKQREEDDARRRGDFEAMIKARDEELKAKNAKLAEIEGMISKAAKQNAVLEALGSNIDPKWHQLINVEKIAVDPDTGEIDNLSVAKIAEAFKREFPEAIRKGGNLPATAPQGLEGGSGKISREAWLKLPSKEMSKWKPDQIV